MIEEINNFYLSQTEPTRGAFLALRDIILSLDVNITSEWKYKLPFFYFNGKMFCYLWKDKISNQPYIGIVKGNQIEHPLLEKGNRSKIKILRIDPNADIPVGLIKHILRQAMNFYYSG